MKRAQLFFRGDSGVEDLNAFVQPASLEFTYERRKAIRTEGVTVAKAITGQAIAHNHSHLGFHTGGRRSVIKGTQSSGQ